MYTASEPLIEELVEVNRSYLWLPTFTSTVPLSSLRFPPPPSTSLPYCSEILTVPPKLGVINLLLKLEPVELPSKVPKLFIIWKLYSCFPYSFIASSNAVKKLAACNSISTNGYPKL